MITEKLYRSTFNIQHLLEEKEKKEKNKKTIILILTQSEESLGSTAEAIKEYCDKDEK